MVVALGTLALAAGAGAVAPGWGSVVITSDSMAPSISRGDVVVMREHGGEPRAPGDVIVFDDPAGPGLVTHRILDVLDDGGYATKGDANGRRDSDPVPDAAIHGIGRVLVPLAGLPFVWASNGEFGKLAAATAGAIIALWACRWALLTRFDPWSRPVTPPINIEARLKLGRGRLKGQRGAAPARRDPRWRVPRIAAAFVPIVLVLSQLGPASDLVPGQARAAVTSATDNSANSFVAAPSFGCSVAFDAQSSAAAKTNSLQWTHTVSATAADRLLLVGVSSDRETVTRTRWLGTDLQFLGEQWAPDGKTRVEIWYLTNPASGTGLVEVNTTGSRALVAGATSWSCVDQTAPFESTVFVAGTGTLATATLTSSPDGVVVDALALKKDTVTAAPPQTEHWALSQGGLAGTASSQPGAASVTTSWSILTDRPWALGVVGLRAGE